MDGEDLRPKVMGQLKNALQPSISEVGIIWNGIKGEDDLKVGTEPEIETRRTLLGFMKPKMTSQKLLQLQGQAPLKIPPIYDGSRLLVYHLFSEKVKNVPKSVTITANTPDGPLSVDLPISNSCIIGGNFVHQLAARKRIQDLEEMIHDEDKEDIENAIVQLGIKYRLASKHTSFVGVDERSPREFFELAMISREIANQVPVGFGSRPERMQSLPTSNFLTKGKSVYLDQLNKKASFDAAGHVAQALSQLDYIDSPNDHIDSMKSSKGFEKSRAKSVKSGFAFGSSMKGVKGAREIGSVKSMPGFAFGSVKGVKEAKEVGSVKSASGFSFGSSESRCQFHQHFMNKYFYQSGLCSFYEPIVCVYNFLSKGTHCKICP